MLSLKSARFRAQVTPLWVMVVAGCASYHQNVMFQTAEGDPGKGIGPELVKAEKNYVIQTNDYLKLEVFSNKGERIIDPNGELLKNEGVTGENLRTQPIYLVATDGVARFPMIEPVRLEGMSIGQAEQLLQMEYNKFYKECYVILSFTNKRVIVLGSVGGQVIPLVNENVSLTEVLALAKGIDNDGMANNIRLLRGEDVYVIDFSTVDGYRRSNMIVQPGDIVYVEPIRRPFAESFADFAPFLSFIFSMTTLIIVILTIPN